MFHIEFALNFLANICMRKNVVTVIMLLALGSVFYACTKDNAVQANFDVIPLPQEIQTTAVGDFVLNNNTVIVYPAGDDTMKRNAEFLAGYIKEQTGKELEVTDKSVDRNAIILSTGLDDKNKEAYHLEVEKHLIRIQGASAAGVFYGIQTLRKTMPVAEGDVLFPSAVVNDYPRFSYRGVHLDVSRHFFPADSIKRFIDMLALHNINRFHWHLTDDQGWRIEIKKRPELTTIGSKRAGTVIARNSGEYDNVEYGGFYTQEEARDIVKYAQERFITVVPEIDLPGHMQAALAAYPYLGCTGGPYEVWKQWGISDDVLCAGNDETLKFIEDVLGEIVDIFPSEYIHVGGDECPKVRWQKCPKCQARIKALGIKADDKHTAEQKLQSYIIGYAEKFLNSKGRKIIGWDEILEGELSPTATVMSWRGSEGGIEAAKLGNDAIMTPASHLYFDYYQTIDTENEPLAIGGYVSVERVYSYEPVDQSLTADEAKHIIGVQANLWTEYIPTYSQLEYMELPRLAALSEVQWTLPAKKNYDNFLQRLPQLISIYDLKGYNYAKHVFNVKAEYITDYVDNSIKVVLSAIGNSPIYYTLDGSEPTAKSQQYSDTLSLKESCVLKAITIRNNKKSDVLTEKIDFNKATAKPLTLLQPINEKYKFNGEYTLVDGLSGTPNYRTGRWIAFYKNDMEAVVDLKQETSIHKAWVRTYVEIGEEILDVRSISVLASDDGKTFKELKTEDFPPVTSKDKNGIYTHELEFNSVNTRYVKIIAKPEYKIPAWHWGNGRPAFIFVDEIGIE